MWVLLCSVGGSFWYSNASLRVGKNETPPSKAYVAYSVKRTAIGGQFGWGGTLLKGYQQGPKVDSTGLEILCRVQEQKSAWLYFEAKEMQERKFGLANLYVLIDGG